MDTWKWIKVRASHGGAMEGLWGRTWGAPKHTKMHQNGHHSMTEQSVLNLSWVNDIFGLNGHLKKARSQSMSWRGHGVALKVHENEPKCTKMHQKGQHCKTDQKVLNLSSVSNMALHMRFTKTRNLYREGPNNTIHFQKRWCILVQLMHYPMTHNLLRLLSPFKCLFNPETDNIFH